MQMHKNIIIFLVVLISFKLSAKSDTTKVSEAEKYTLLIKSFGLAIYFTPHKGYKTEDWEDFLLQSMHELDQVDGTKSSIKAINNLYQKINISIKIDTIKNKWTGDNTSNRTNIYYWKHTGLGLGKDKLPNVTKLITLGYKSKVEMLSNSTIKNESIHLGNNYYCNFPLYSDHIAKLKRLNFYNDIEYTKKGSDFALLAYVWNIYNYFYSYTAELNIDWDEQLQNSINSLLKHEKIEDVLNTLNKTLNDAHAHIAVDSKIKGMSFVEKEYYPLNFEYLDSKIVVSAISNDYQQFIETGDILIRVNNEDIDSVITRLIEPYSGKKETSIHSEVEGWSKLGFLHSLFNNYYSADSLKLTFINSAGLQKNSVILKTDNQYDRLSTSSFIHDGYYYIDAGEFNYTDFKKNMKSIEQSKGIFFDLRTFPTYRFTHILSHFTEHDLFLDNLFTPIVTSPVNENQEYKSVTGFKIKSAKKQINLPVYFITGPGLYSYGESCIHLIKKGELGLTIGDYTGGCNGDINYNRVFNTTITWTGKKVLNLEGEVFQAIGYNPDISFKFELKHIDKKLLIKDLLQEIKKIPNTTDNE